MIDYKGFKDIMDDFESESPKSKKFSSDVPKKLIFNYKNEPGVYGKYTNADKLSDEQLREEAEFIIRKEKYAPDKFASEFSACSGIANELMKRGINKRSFPLAIAGASVYSVLGRANRPSVRRRLEKAAKYSAIDEVPLKKIEKKLGIENKVNTNNLGSAIFGLLFVAGFFLSSSGITGNAIGVSQNSINFIGIGLMLLGAVGFFVYRKFR